MSATTTKKRIRIPSVCIDVRLDEFDVEEIRQYLRDKGQDAVEIEDSNCDDNHNRIEDEDLSRIEMLATCGQTQQARELALEIVGEFIGRTL